MRCFSAYPMSCDKRNIVKHWQILTNLSSSGRSNWCLAGDIFWRKKVGCRIMDGILRPRSLNCVHAMIIGRLRVYTIPLEPSNGTKIRVVGGFFGGFDDWSDASARINFGMNGLYSAILLPFKSLNYIIIALEWKWDGSVPMQCLEISVTWQIMGKTDQFQLIWKVNLVSSWGHVLATKGRI